MGDAGSSATGVRGAGVWWSVSAPPSRLRRRLHTEHGAAEAGAPALAKGQSQETVRIKYSLILLIRTQIYG